MWTLASDNSELGAYQFKIIYETCTNVVIIPYSSQTAVFDPAEVAEKLHTVIRAAVRFAEVDVALCSQFLESIINNLAVK